MSNSNIIILNVFLMEYINYIIVCVVILSSVCCCLCVGSCCLCKLVVIVYNAIMSFCTTLSIHVVCVRLSVCTSVKCD